MFDDKVRSSVAADLGSLASELAAIAGTSRAPLRPGARVGNFVIEGSLGRGGMGEVYRARDPRLGRAVAIKLGRRGANLERARREATALARLAHPNVVTIYEVGDHEGQVFVAMELVPGGTARQWLAAAPRSWQDIVSLYADAGRGLAAAHAAGLVHRDIKPENVLVGSDGRARVADFGLARDVATLAVGSEPHLAGAEHAVQATLPAARAASAEPSVTAAGMVVGTPRYMAPEQRRGGAVDARSDQFALGVALYEALAGVDPFGGGANREEAIRARRLSPPVRVVPRRILGVVARALADAPEARWPGVEAMVEALLRARRPRWPYAAAVAVAVLAAAGVGSSMRAAPDRGVGRLAEAPIACATLPSDLDTTWNPAVRRAVIARNPSATSSATWLADVLDHYAAAWPAVRRAACVTNPSDRAWSPVLLDRAVACLAQRHAEMAKVLAVRGQPAGEVVAAAMTLHDPRECGDLAVMTQSLARGRRTPEVEQVEQLTELASDAENAGDRTRAKAQGEQALALAQRSGQPLARAIALETVGESELWRHEIAPAAEHLKAAYFEYRGLGDQAHTYRTALMVTQLVAQAGKHDEADQWLGHTRAEAERTGATPEKAIAVALVGAQLLGARGRLDDAIATIDRTLPQIRNEPDPRYLTDYSNALGNKAMYEGMAGRHADALVTARSALVVQERIYGADHPQLLELLQTIGLAQRDLGQLDAALVTLDRARKLAVAGMPVGADLRCSAIIDYARALGAKDRRAGLAVLDELRAELAATPGTGIEPATRKELETARAALAGAAPR